MRIPSSGELHVLTRLNWGTGSREHPSRRQDRFSISCDSLANQYTLLGMSRLNPLTTTRQIAGSTSGRRLIWGFGALLLLLVMVSGISYLVVRSASSGFTGYREMARDANLAGRLQANMLMVRMNVKDFIITGSYKDLQ